MEGRSPSRRHSAGGRGIVGLGDPSSEPGEEVRGSWVASIPFKRFDLAKEGGNLVLTDRHLLFRPLRVPIPIGDVFVISDAGARWSVRLDEIRAVSAVQEKRSQLRVATADGEARDFIVAARRTASFRNPNNAPTRDEAVERITAAIRTAPQLQGPPPSSERP